MYNINSCVNVGSFVNRTVYYLCVCVCHWFVTCAVCRGCDWATQKCQMPACCSLEVIVCRFIQSSTI